MWDLSLTLGAEANLHALLSQGYLVGSGGDGIFNLQAWSHPMFRRGVRLSDGNRSGFRLVANLLGPLNGLLSQ